MEKNKNSIISNKSDCIAIYLRLSKEDDEKEESNSIGNQRNLLLQFIQNRQEFNGCNILEFTDRKTLNLIQMADMRDEKKMV